MRAGAAGPGRGGLGEYYSGLGDARAWRTPVALGLDECGLDDAEFEGLAEVDAPRLRAVSLEFNALRERGGRTLAGAVLPRLWWVGLHDSVVEDGAVVALASGVARRLLELDLERVGQEPAPEPGPIDEELRDQDFQGRRVARHREGVARAVGFARSLVDGG
ncbi:hypothetical protein [Actinosynnema pretiosum]|uniref:Uncharacterized protein n=1 Tax=Actinosynnema pretiosum TaxID=42197 RepID=A0A290Z2N7_9PSEU|nr:hypothetical protein [Actinosynnema pretiosum]ATE53235.1 hypothetical protein CNX65_07985 [Actinosynnema pretiosum]